MKLEEFKKIISDAISNEEEAYLFYEDVAAKTKDENIASIFKDLAKEELSHKELLSGYLAGNVRPFVFDATADYKVTESLDTPKLSTNMKPADAIALAMKKEEEAMNMYNELAALSTDAEQKEAFRGLAKMEQGHKTKMEILYVDAAFPEAW